MEDVYKWALGAQPGQRVVYHVGERDDASRSELGTVEMAFAKAMSAHNAGLVFLAQRRLWKGQHAGHLQYEATKLSEQAAKALGLTGRSLSYRGVAA